MDKKWHDYRTGAKQIMCGCSQKRINTVPSSRMMASSPALQSVSKEDFASVSESMVLLEYKGEHLGAVTIKGPVTRQNYRFGRQPGHNIRKVFAADAKVFLSKRNRDGSPEYVVYQSDRLPSEVLEFLKK
jgi:hypothetical protein